MWEQKRLSLFPLVEVLVLLAASVHRSIVPTISASSSCSNSFRFDHLCPDPRAGSRELIFAGDGYENSPDTTLMLNRDANSGRGMNGYGGRGSSGGSTYSSLELAKDPSSSSCDFHVNGVETAVIAGVNVMEKPWNFRGANKCNHIVRLSYDFYDNGGLGNGVKPKRGNEKNDSVCSKEIGIKRHVNRNLDYEDLAPTDEEFEKKMSVYFWHNFTIYRHSVQFMDMVTNYHLSRDDILCKNESRSGLYVQIAIWVSKSGRCEIMVQQYKIETNRSRWGCTQPGYPVPNPSQFCGSYECSRSNSILTGMKLSSRKLDDDDDNDDDDGRSRSVLVSRTDDDDYDVVDHVNVHIKPKGPSLPEEQHYNYSKEQYNYEDYPTTPAPSPTTTPGDLVEEVKASGEIDWYEMAFLAGFPGFGVIFIAFILFILRAQIGREICHGYPYESQQRSGSVYQPRPGSREGFSIAGKTGQTLQIC